MAQRSGLPTIRETCAFLCGFLAVYIPVIRKLFPDDTDLHTALDLLQVAVCALVLEADEVLPVGD
jgi:hypothetical protein